MIVCVEDNVRMQYKFRLGVGDSQINFTVPYHNYGSMQVGGLVHAMKDRMRDPYDGRGRRLECLDNIDNVHAMFNLSVAVDRARDRQPETRQMVRQLMEASILA